ncbi:GNAT family N-acetyltransferase [Jannaschia aquimarina]|uniref:Acetyltransferase (GNAT) family protein n=1 Tax=Jannaschia aquimarina TaxID=935700 RepID=A0A0D1CSG2_9RHOB|nr:GNAT family N-acetyltransferase [Jannaschia aquimarina]KIT17712.1 Acetyltransferase (GNAT) family protein [Jannaschia aquimarina]SNS78397.1 Acetyltransferase (GNAT) domain-containing protein [Jannaschia aquimarina]
MTSEGFDWSDAPPSPEAYVALRAAAGLGPRTLEAARRALPAGLCTVTVHHGERLVAMGRVVGDGGCFVQIVDVAVEPACQGDGLGRAVVNRLIDWIETNLPACCHVSLVSSERAEPLYARVGFERCLGMDRYAGAARLSPVLE